MDVEMMAHLLNHADAIVDMCESHQGGQQAEHEGLIRLQPQASGHTKCHGEKQQVQCLAPCRCHLADDETARDVGEKSAKKEVEEAWLMT